MPETRYNIRAAQSQDIIAAPCCSVLYTALRWSMLLAWYLEDEDLQPRLRPQSALEVHSESTLNKSFYKQTVCQQADPEIQKHFKMLRRTQASGAKVEARTKPVPCVCVSVSICWCHRFCLSLTCTLCLPDFSPQLKHFCILPILFWLGGEQVAMLAKQPAMRMKVQ